LLVSEIEMDLPRRDAVMQQVIEDAGNTNTTTWEGATTTKPPQNHQQSV
jgi:hypothetical protein